MDILLSVQNQIELMANSFKMRDEDFKCVLMPSSSYPDVSHFRLAWAPPIFQPEMAEGMQSILWGDDYENVFTVALPVTLTFHSETSDASEEADFDILQYMLKFGTMFIFERPFSAPLLAMDKKDSLSDLDIAGGYCKIHLERNQGGDVATTITSTDDNGTQLDGQFIREQQWTGTIFFRITGGLKDGN